MVLLSSFYHHREEMSLSFWFPFGICSFIVVLFISSITEFSHISNQFLLLGNREQLDPIGSFRQQAFQSANLALWNRRVGTLGFRQGINLILWKPKTDTLGFTNLPPGKPKGSRNNSFGRCHSNRLPGCLSRRTAPPSKAP